MFSVSDLDELSSLSCPVLLSAFSCIVCLHQAPPQKPSLTLQRLEFGLIYRHQSLFVWMSYGLTLLVCSFVVITKAHTVTGKRPLNYFVSQRLSGGGSWHSKHPSFPTAPLTPNCKPTNPSGPPGIYRIKQKGLDPNMRVLLKDLEYVFLTPVHSVYIVLE